MARHKPSDGLCRASPELLLFVSGSAFDGTAMGVGVVFGGFAGMVCRMKAVSVRYMRVVRSLFVVLFGVVFSSFAVVSRSMLVVVSSFFVVFRSFVVFHRTILFLGEMYGCRLRGRLRAVVHQDFSRVLVTA
jgi:hypothetical protein